MSGDEKWTKKELMGELSRLRLRVADLKETEAYHRRVAKAAQACEARYRRSFESARIGILILDARTGSILDANPFLAGMLGFARSDLQDKRLWELDTFKRVHSPEIIFQALLSNTNSRHENLMLDTKDGRRIEVEIVCNAYPAQTPSEIHCSIRDVTESRKAEERLRHLSTHDELTGLHNRIFLHEEMSRLGRSRQFPVTIIVADVDALKQVNGKLGNASGDDLLKRAASVLRKAFRADEIVARYDGDEFVVLLPKTDAVTAALTLDRVRNRLSVHNSSQDGPPLNLSLGAATAESPQSMVDVLEKAALQMSGDKLAHRSGGMHIAPRDLQLIFKQIDAKLSANPGLHMSRLASELGCERHIIERAVKEVKSMQFRQYQQIRRLETALYLLDQKPLLIKEIAGALGYTSPTSVWRLLKTRMRKSPRDIRTFRGETADPHYS